MTLGCQNRDRQRSLLSGTATITWESVKMPMKVNCTVVNGEILSENRNGVIRDYVPDTLGSTIALLDNTRYRHLITDLPQFSEGFHYIYITRESH